MIAVNEKCTGCLACCCICPQKCITVERDFEWFMYPKLNKSKCTNCGLCESVCHNYNNKLEI